MKDKDFNSSINGMGWKVENAFKSLVETLEEADKRVKELEQKLKDALGVKTFQPYKEYQYKTLKTWKAPDYYSYDRSEKPAYTVEQLEELRKQDLLVAAENKVILEQNKISHKTATDYLLNLGLKTTKYAYTSSRSRNKKQVGCEWVNEIAALFPSCPLDSDVNNYYDREIKRIQEYFKKIEDEKEVKAQAIAKDKKIKERDAFLIRISDKYQLGFNDIPSAEEVLDLLIEENKYLALGHYLLKNRENYNEGPNFAEYGLSQFFVETPEEQLIYDTIQELCINWGGDGRVFRDCNKANYGEMFGIAAEQNKELYDDFMKVREYAS